MREPAPPSAPTLRKLGADLRWLIEKSGLDPEKALVTISVPDPAALVKLAETLTKEFDASVMQPVTPNIMTVHGVYLHFAVNSNLNALTTYDRPIRRPSEPA